MGSLRRFIENNFDLDNDLYPCTLPTLERVMKANGYRLIATEHVNSRLESYYWYNSNCGDSSHIVEINIYDNVRWSPVIREWERESIETILKVTL